MAGNWARGTWFITGASSGIGSALGHVVLERGGRVVATARSTAGVMELVRAGGERVLPLALDVRDVEQARSAVRVAEAEFGPIDVLVNNAGYGLLGSIEEASDEEIQQIFAVNFFGQVNVTKEALPYMRARKRGYIVNLSSMVAADAREGAGYYAATKCAVEGMSEALRLELEPIGIGVLIVEPGPFRTNYAQKYLVKAGRVISDYDSTAGRMRAMVELRHGNQPGDPRRAAQAIIEAIQHERPPRRLVLGRTAVEVIRAALERRLEELEHWKGMAMSADFDGS